MLRMDNISIRFNLRKQHVGKNFTVFVSNSPFPIFPNYQQIRPAIFSEELLIKSLNSEI